MLLFLSYSDIFEYYFCSFFPEVAEMYIGPNLSLSGEPEI